MESHRSPRHTRWSDTPGEWKGEVKNGLSGARAGYNDGRAASRKDLQALGCDGMVTMGNPGEDADDRLAAAERRRRRAEFLRERAEARALRARVTPLRTRNARLRAILRMRTFRRS